MLCWGTGDRKMMNYEERGLATILGVFDESQLFPPEEIKIVEEYFEGESDAAALEKLESRNLNFMFVELADELRWLLRNGTDEEVVKAGNVYFAIGGVDTYSCYPEEIYSEDCCIFAEEPEKKAALFAEHISRVMERMEEPYLRQLMGMAHNDPEIIKKAYEYQIESAGNSIVLLTVYFLLKYPEINSANRVDDFSKLLTRQGCPEQEAAEEIALMQQYEDLLIQNIGGIYLNQYEDTRPQEEVINEIKEAIRNGRVDENILKLAVAKKSDYCDEYLDRYWRCHMGMAFINFPLSARVRDVLSVCFAARTGEMIYVVASLDMRGDFSERGGNFDEIFHIDSDTLIRYGSYLMEGNILKEQFQRNREAYLAWMEKDTLLIEPYQFMCEIIAEVDPAFHKEREQMELARQQKLLIDLFVTGNMKKQKAEQVRKYLSGEKDVEYLYSIAEGILPIGDGRNYTYWQAMQDYRKACGYDSLCKRCEVVMMVCGAWEYLEYLLEDGELKKERVKELFRSMEEENLSLDRQFDGLLKLCDSLRFEKKKRNTVMGAGKEIFGAYLAKRHDEMMEIFLKADVPGKILGMQILARNKKTSMEEFTSFLQDKSKEVKEALVDVLCKLKNREAEVVGLLSSAKVAEREVAVRVLAKWNMEEKESAKDMHSIEKYASLLKEAWEKETNAKVRSLLGTVVPVDVLKASEGEESVSADIVKALHKGNKKRSLAWAYSTPFPKVHKKDGKEADEEYLQAILLAYSALSLKGELPLNSGGAPEIGKTSEDGNTSGRHKESTLLYNISPAAAVLTRELDEREFAIYVNEVLDRWVAAGVEPRKRWILYMAAFHGGADMPERLHQLIQEWAGDHATVSIEAQRALALSLKPQALLVVDGISRKFTPHKIQTAAKKALRAVASWLGTTREGLLDRTVPDLGFDENRERCFDYGRRKFTVALTAGLEIECFDENGKKLKNLPAPGKQDDETKATEAYEEFKLLKKQIKGAVSAQKARLETALSDGREWGIEEWKNLFVKNPLMHQFATGLIWGLYEDGELVFSFRYMEDGTFNTEDMEEIQLPEEEHSLDDSGTQKNRKVKIVHPVELSDESYGAWSEQLEDYEIIQPVEQLDRLIYEIDEDEKEKQKLERFHGRHVDEKILKKRLKKFGWECIDDEFGYFVYYKENEELLMGAEIAFEFNYDYYGAMTIYEGRFYHQIEIGEIPEEDNVCLMGEVPERYFSEIVKQLDEVTEED